MVRLLGVDFQAGLADLGAQARGGAAAEGLAQQAAVNALHGRSLSLSHRGSGGSGRALIIFLILVHLAFVAYWAVVWLRQRRRQRTDGRQRSAGSTPKAVGCTYDWTPTMPQKLPVLPKIPNIQLIQLPKSAQH